MNSIMRGKDWIAEFYNQHILFEGGIKTVLDVGCGRGMWAGCLRGPKDSATWHGIEVHGPYLEQFKTIHERLYDEIYNVNILDFKWDNYDLVIFGDILEHLSLEYCQRVLRKAKEHAKYIVISVPLNAVPHPAEHGNPYQEHKQDNLTKETVLKEYVVDIGLVLHNFRSYHCGWLHNPLDIGVIIASGDLFDGE